MSPEEIVRAEIAAWARNDVDEVMSHFAEDAEFAIGPAWPRLSGHGAISEMMKQFFAGGTCVDLEIRHLAVDGDVVLMERFDHWIVAGTKRSWPVMGAYQGAVVVDPQACDLDVRALEEHSGPVERTWGQGPIMGVSYASRSSTRSHPCPPGQCPRSSRALTN